VLPRQRQLGVVGQVIWELGANVNGSKVCYLGASIALGLFPEIFPSWVYLRKTFEKGLKKIKKTVRSSTAQIVEMDIGILDSDCTGGGRRRPKLIASVENSHALVRTHASGSRGRRPRWK
jgi:hypothetical protein